MDELSDPNGLCYVCHTMFERPNIEITKEHPGFLCPCCKEHGYSIVGVVQFTPDCQLNVLPEGISTA